MSEIIDRDVKTRREVWKRDKAIAHFKKIGEKYKAEIIESIPETKNYLFIIMVTLGMIYAEALIWFHLAKSEKRSN